jgi:UDP-2,3-diacylglucosamine hydrolase
MRAVFISDIHLISATDERYKKLMRFFDALEAGNIQTLVHNGGSGNEKIFVDHLYIVGDLFDFWFCEADNIYPDFQPVIAKLLALKKSGTAIHLGEGNHDFFLAEYFRGRLGMDVFEENASLQFDDTRVFVAHGDTADRTNRSYLMFRKFLRSRFFYRAQGRIPASWRWAIAGWSSTASKKMTRESGETLADKMQPFAMERFHEGYDAVILGHSHVPQEKTFLINQKQKRLITLGDWITHCSFLYYDDNTFFLKRYRG